MDGGWGGGGGQIRKKERKRMWGGGAFIHITRDRETKRITDERGGTDKKTETDRARQSKTDTMITVSDTKQNAHATSETRQHELHCSLITPAQQYRWY